MFDGHPCFCWFRHAMNLMLFLSLQSVCLFVCLFDLILYVPSTIFQLNRDESSWDELVLS